MAITICDKLHNIEAYLYYSPSIKMHILERLVYRLLNTPEKLTVQVLSESLTVNHCQS